MNRKTRVQTLDFHTRFSSVNAERHCLIICKLHFPTKQMSENKCK